MYSYHIVAETRQRQIALTIQWLTKFTFFFWPCFTKTGKHGFAKGILAHAIAREFLRDVGPDGLRGRDVGFARGDVAAAGLRQAPAVQRGR